MTYSYHQLIAAAVKGPFEQILYIVLWTGTWEQIVTSLLLFQLEELCFQCRCNIMTFSHQAKTYLHCGNSITHFATHYQHNCQRNEWVVAPATPRVTYPLCSLGEQCAEEEKEILKGEAECILQIKRRPT
jgi:hypothetical protein